MKTLRNGGNQWLDEFVPYQVYRITNSLDQRLRARLRGMKINISRWRVLGVLRAYGTLTINQIATLSVMEQPNISRTVSRLAKDGLVKRTSASDDSRSVKVSLTPSGRNAFDRIHPIAVEHQTTALSSFSEQDIETLTKLLRRMHDNISSERSDLC